jgi:hypothetical protein
MFADKVDTFDPVLALGYNLDISDVFQQEGEFIAGKLLIVHYDGGQGHSILLANNQKYIECQLKVLQARP